MNEPSRKTPFDRNALETSPFRNPGTNPPSRLESRFCGVEFAMRKSNWTPSIVPNGCDQSVYLVMDDFGRLGRVWREADVEYTNFETVVLDLLEGQCEHPIRVVCFNSAEQWSQDVSVDVARELRRLGFFFFRNP
jgi:hypothetical protein